MSADKDLWRWRMKSALALQRPWDSSHALDRLKENLRLIVSGRPGIWATYRPLPLEADPFLDPIAGVEWVHPRMAGKSLEFFKAKSFVKGRFGILEPCGESEIVDPFQLVGILVPGLAFDKAGRRLGRGQGFYDRTLAGTDALTVGVAAAIQRIAQVPADPWDVNVQAVVTEQTVYWVED